MAIRMKGMMTSTGIGLVIAAVVLVVGVFTFEQVFSAIPAQTGSANTTLQTIKTTTESAFNLAVVGLIVLAAVAILSIIFLLGGRQ